MTVLDQHKQHGDHPERLSAEEIVGNKFVRAIRELRTGAAIYKFLIDYYDSLTTLDKIHDPFPIVHAVIRLALNNYEESKPNDYDQVSKQWKDGLKKLKTRGPQRE